MPASPAAPADAHRTVLALPAVQWLLTSADGTYVDATFGRGGHARLILQRLAAGGRLFAFDRDPQAEAAAAAIVDARFRFVRTRFSRLGDTLAALGVAHVEGVLLDIGVSSPQIDDPARGFSLRGDGPLDMRMDPSQGQSAAQWLACATVDELTRVIRDYGEERFAAPIAKAIVARREAGRPPATTTDLAGLVADTIAVKGRKSPKDGAQHPATRTFQAVRIHVNQELEELALALEQSVRLLATGARLVVISFHSLEDRIVKRFIEAHAHPDRVPAGQSARAARLPLRAADLPRPTLTPLAKVMPEAAEIAANPRARSAVMRVAERTAQPLRATPAGGSR
jgi:16S rRNA (cytosine1402-N4)-methyltransferase